MSRHLRFFISSLQMACQYVDVLESSMRLRFVIVEAIWMCNSTGKWRVKSISVNKQDPGQMEDDLSTAFSLLGLRGHCEWQFVQWLADREDHEVVIDRESTVFLAEIATSLMYGDMALLPLAKRVVIAKTLYALYLNARTTNSTIADKKNK